MTLDPISVGIFAVLGLIVLAMSSAVVGTVQGARDLAAEGDKGPAAVLIGILAVVAVLAVLGYVLGPPAPAGDWDQVVCHIPGVATADHPTGCDPTGVVVHTTTTTATDSERPGGGR